MKHVLIISISILVSCILYLVSSKSAYADLALGVYPPITQINITTPADSKSPITIQNSGDTTLNLDIFFKEFTQSSTNNGTIEYLPPNQFTGADLAIFQKIKVLEDGNDVSAVSLAPKEQKTLTLEVNVPKDEPPSDYYFSILFLSKGTTADSKNNSAVSGGIATNVLLSIGPNGKAFGTIQEFSAPFFVMSGPVAFTASVYNLSNFFIQPKGQILIRSSSGEIVGKIDLLPVNILANTARVLPDSVSQNQDLPTGRQDSAVFQQKILLGLYSAELVIALTPDGPILHKTIYFFALPLPYIIGLSLGIIIVVLVMLRVREKLRLPH